MAWFVVTDNEVNASTEEDLLISIEFNVGVI